MANLHRTTLLLINDTEISSAKPRIWRRILDKVISAAPGLLLAVAGGAVAYLVIPITFSRYNDVKSLRDARLAKAIKFADRNAEAVSKIHSEATLLNMFVSHNERMNVQGSDLKKARGDLRENYGKRYLDIDSTEWWWTWDFEREIRALNLLSPDELEQLNKYIRDYSYRANHSIYAPIYLWEFLDSPKYKVGDKKSKQEIKRIQNCIQEIFADHDQARSVMVQKITALFAHSEFRTDWYHIVGLPQKEPQFEP